MGRIGVWLDNRFERQLAPAMRRARHAESRMIVATNGLIAQILQSHGGEMTRENSREASVG